MKRKLKRLMATTLVTLTMVAQPVLADNVAPMPATMAASTGASVFAPVQGLDNVERNQKYESLALSPSGWQTGMVISKEPYAVVIQADEQGANVRIWTGLIARDNNDLMAFWDEIRVLKNGHLDFHATDVEETTRGYFEAASQENFRTKAYLGKVPWANIPTDAEAAQAKLPKVTGDGSVLNVYGIVFKDPNRAVAATTGSVKKLADMPEVIPTLKKFKETAVAGVPGDAVTHWAKDDILDLMKKSIIEGYEDGTIRPDRTLSKAEFVTLLVKSLGLEPSKAPAAEYADLSAHWSQPMIAAAQGFGLLDKKPVDLNFSPDSPISRVDMVVLLSRVLQKYDVSSPTVTLSFNDTANLPSANISALQAVINAGIVGGYEDGSFRPQGSLTRAEAFKVISRIIQLL